MDFLDPKKQKAHRVRLAIGYALIAIALLLGTVILLYQAYGFGIDRTGRVIQNGLIFLSSQPANADIYVNGQVRDTTNTRLQLPGGSYTIELKRDGYRDWKREIAVQGGKVDRYDYPFLFPKKLTTTVAKQYSATPLLATQSPDRRWIMIQTLAPDQFDLYDLNADKPTPQPLIVPTEALATGTTTAWEATEWAPDNKHVILKRSYQKDGQPGTQYVLFDRDNPTTSQNLSTLFGLTPTNITFTDGHYDQYYLFDQIGAQILTATLKKPTPTPYVSGVLAFAAREDRLLYVTTQDMPSGKVEVRLRDNDKTYHLRQLPAQSMYLLNLAVYNDDWYIAAGAQTEGKVFVYRNPEDSLNEKPKSALVPVQILRVDAANYLSFSTNYRFVMIENGDHFAVYDAETDRSYTYATGKSLDAPQTHAGWTDGYHLDVVSGGKLVVFDFDGANLQTLSAAAPAYKPFFSRNYHAFYTLTTQNALTTTSLLVE